MGKVSLEINFKMLEKIKKHAMFGNNSGMPKNLTYEQAQILITISALEAVLGEYNITSPFTLAKEFKRSNNEGL